MTHLQFNFIQWVLEDEDLVVRVLEEIFGVPEECDSIPEDSVSEVRKILDNLQHVNN